MALILVVEESLLVEPKKYPIQIEIEQRALEIQLTAEERTRYRRHLLLPQVGQNGQRRLKAAKVLVIGAGGLGSPVSLYLTAAGVGTLGIAEFDTVDRSNLQRQVLYGTRDAGQPKLAAAARRLRELNPMVSLREHPVSVDETNVMELVTQYDLVIDGSDNLRTRYLVNDVCVVSERPYIYGAVDRFHGQLSVFYAPHGPCYRCLFPAPPAPEQTLSCTEAGVLGVLPGQIGLMQATEAIKLITGIGEPLLGVILSVDLLQTRYDRLRLERDQNCPVCGHRPGGRAPSHCGG